MLFDKYEQDGLLFNMKFKSNTSDAGVVAYRGELVLVEGEVTDAQGRRKPPVMVMRHTAMLEKDGKLAMMTGCLDRLDMLENLLAKYQDDFASGMRAVFFVVNITESMQLEIAGAHFILIPLTDGIAWNELTEELGVEKVELKGKSPADKVVVVSDELSSYSPNYTTVASFDEAMGKTADIKREARGPV